MSTQDTNCSHCGHDAHEEATLGMCYVNRCHCAVKRSEATFEDEMLAALEALDKSYQWMNISGSKDSAVRLTDIQIAVVMARIRCAKNWQDACQEKDRKIERLRAENKDLREKWEALIASARTVLRLCGER